jgi:hypothetical protein
MFMSVRENAQQNVAGQPYEGLVDIAEAARILAVSVSTVCGWV